MTSGTAGTTFYLAKDGERICWLVAVQGDDMWSATAYGYVPDFSAFVFNRPLTADFQIERGLTYEPLSPHDAMDIIEADTIRPLCDQPGLADLLDEMRAEPDRLDIAVVLAHAQHDANGAGRRDPSRDDVQSIDTEDPRGRD